jgi:3-isopropylmalate/(R)-2-methylmalate dehydratase large subunit
MAMTIIEKLIARHTGEEVAPGQVVWMDLDVRSARDFGGANVVQHFQREYGTSAVADQAKTLFTFDCVAPAVTIPYANNQQVCRQFAREQGIRVFDVDAGIGSHVMLEQGYVHPGVTVVGTDSHLNILGAVGAFGQGMGDQDIAFAFKVGKTWFEVPETIKIVIRGQYQYPTTAKDLTLFVVGKLGAKGALGKAVEFYGEQIERLNLAERLTLASMATEMGAIAALLPPTEEILDYCQKRQRPGGHVTPIAADLDAHYCQVMEVDVSGLPPQLAAPPKPSAVAPVSEHRGKPVDSIFLGSCTNGRYEDFAQVAEFLGTRKIKSSVMAKIVPATREVYGQLLDQGLVQRFFDAGIIVSHAACGGCASGQIGMTGENEVQLSTSNRNFPGKQGAGDTFLVSPLTAIASAIAGEIVSPEELL